MRSVTPQLEVVPAHLQADGVLPEPVLEPIVSALTAHNEFRYHIAAATYRALYAIATSPGPNASRSTETDTGIVDEGRRKLCIKQLAVLTLLHNRIKASIGEKHSEEAKDKPDLLPGYYSTLLSVMKQQRISDKDVRQYIRKRNQSAERIRTDRPSARHHTHLTR